MTPAEGTTFVVTDVELDGPSPLRNSMLSFASVAIDGRGAVLDQFEAVLTPRAGEPVLLRFVRSAGVLIHTLIGLAAGAAAALALLPALDPAATTRLLAVTLVQAIVCERAISVSARRRFDQFVRSRAEN